MTIAFKKYHGTGNDFILIDDRALTFAATQEQIANLCHRRFGIGADGLILLRSHARADFEMIYYNSDGRLGSLCGNGARCITAFAFNLGIITKQARFMAFDGPHESEVQEMNLNTNHFQIKLKMNDVQAIAPNADSCFMNTGSPHLVLAKDLIAELDVFTEGRRIRYSKPFAEEGTNVDFICKTSNGIAMRVYERGVEDETYSSGTGAVACALSADLFGWTQSPCTLSTKGGVLQVDYDKSELTFTNIWLTGPAIKTYEGSIDLKP